MTRDEMIADLRVKLGDRANTLDSTELIAALNEVYRFELPNNVDGMFREGKFNLVLQPGKAVYNLDFDADMGAGRGGQVRNILERFFFIEGSRANPLDYYTRHSQFYVHADHESEGTPTSVLVLGRELTFAPTPAESDTVVFTASLYPDLLTAGGIANDDHAQATVRGAARNLAEDLGYDEIRLRQSDAFNRNVRRLLGQSKAAPTTRPSRREF